MSAPATTPRVTFGVIVLNGEPFVRYNLRALYPFAHEIVVVEGASPNAAAVATPDGHSTDGTLETLRRFRETEDPEGKLEIVTRDGFWSEKDEQSRAYAERATGDWLWQVDVDEFYRPEDMRRVLDLLARTDAPDMISFRMRTFWGGLGYRVRSLTEERGAPGIPRVFRFGPGFVYRTHRPVTVLDPEGRDLRTKAWLRGRDTDRMGLYMHHYALLFPKQAAMKTAYYSALSPRYAALAAWKAHSYDRLDRPFRVHNNYRHASWLEPYDGPHPPEILRMMEDVRAGRVRETLRRTDDVEALLARRSYRLGGRLLAAIAPAYARFLKFWWSRPWWLSRGGWRRFRTKAKPA